MAGSSITRLVTARLHWRNPGLSWCAPRDSNRATVVTGKNAPWLSVKVDGTILVSGPAVMTSHTALWSQVRDQSATAERRLVGGSRVTTAAQSA